MAIDKLIVTNVGALRNKYGVGFARVQNAVADLIAKDAARGLQSVLVGVDDAVALANTGVSAVVNVTDPAQNKAAVDALYTKFSLPVYLVILGAWDIVPHQNLANPAQDVDTTVFSDLPYACSGGYSQAIGDFTQPTRLVGRIPDIIGNNDPSYFEQVLGVAANYISRPAVDYQNVFAVSTATWQSSTSHTLLEIFGGPPALNVVPPSNSQWPQASLDALSHFIDCHGRSDQPTFLGESLDAQAQYPIALDVTYLQGKVKPGTVVAAECCYGAQLYDPSLSGGRLGIANEYLRGGAYGYFGSTTISYGRPTQFTQWADDLCRYFFQRLLGGSCLGKAALEARQDYLQANSTFGPRDSKTFAQFILLGDPSLKPLSMAVSPATRFVLARQNLTAMDAAMTARSERLEQRMALYQNGAALGDSVNIVEKQIETRIRRPMLRFLKAEADKLGLEEPTFTRYRVRRARAKPRGAALNDGPSGMLKAVYELSGNRKGMTGTAGLEVHEFDHGVSVFPFVSKDAA